MTTHVHPTTRALRVPALALGAVAMIALSACGPMNASSPVARPGGATVPAETTPGGADAGASTAPSTPGTTETTGTTAATPVGQDTATPVPPVGDHSGDHSAGHSGAPGTTTPVATPNEVLTPVTTDPASYAGDGMGGIFVVLCGPTSHRAADDPIVKPGQPGATHMHDFFGNTTTNAFSTTASLQAAPRGKCDVVDDRSAYWMPTIYQFGQIVEPTSLEVYYMDFARSGRMVAPPLGFRMIAGDMTGQRDTEVNGSVVLGWSCGDQQVDFAKVPRSDCTAANPLVMRVNFPNCWDGTNLDSPDHVSHVSYSSFDLGVFGEVCPASHPVPIPQVRMNVLLPIHDGTGLTLASGGLETIHADFLNAWEPARLEELVAQLNDGGLNPLPGVSDTADDIVAEVLAGLGG